MWLTVDQSLNQPKNGFEGKLLRNITWTHSLIGIWMIKWSCSIHVIRNSLIALLAKQIWKATAVTQTNVLPLN